MTLAPQHACKTFPHPRNKSTEFLGCCGRFDVYLFDGKQQGEWVICPYDGLEFHYIEFNVRRQQWRFMEELGDDAAQNEAKAQLCAFLNIYAPEVFDADS